MRAWGLGRNTCSMIVLGFVILSILLIINLQIMKNEFESPSFIFSASFTFSIGWAMVYAKTWDLKLHFNTFCVVVGGVFEFCIVCWMVHFYYIKYHRRSSIRPSYNYFRPIAIEKSFLWLILFLELFSIAFTLYEIRLASGISNISMALVYYNNITKFTTDVVVFKHAKYLYLIWDIVDAMGFWISYIIANNIITSKKLPKCECGILFVSMMLNFFRGARTTAVCKMMTFVCFYLVLSRKNSVVKKRAISYKFILKVLIASIVFIISFKSIGSLMGRTITTSGMDYVAMYCGAEIKNLDTFLQQSHVRPSKIVDSQTFYVLMKYLRPKFGYTDKVLPDLPYQYVGDINLGNVYTTFYQYVYDYGYFGVVWLVGLMAWLSQMFYEKSKITKKNLTPPLSLLIYGNFFPSLVLSFFSNKFYERHFCTGFVKWIVLWSVFNCALIKIKIRTDRKYRVSSDE